MKLKFDNKRFSKKFRLFFYKYEYSILETAGIFCGLLILNQMKMNYPIKVALTNNPMQFTKLLKK